MMLREDARTGGRGSCPLSPPYLCLRLGDDRRSTQLPAPLFMFSVLELGIDVYVRLRLQDKQALCA